MSIFDPAFADVFFNGRPAQPTAQPKAGITITELIRRGKCFPVLVLIFASIGALSQAPHGTASEEVPRGVIDGTNTTFTLNFQPAPWGSIHVFRNGLRQQRNNDFTLGGPNHTQVIFNLIAAPQPGDILLADYTY
jgi:hypothetical protein